MKTNILYCRFPSKEKSNQQCIYQFGIAEEIKRLFMNEYLKTFNYTSV